MGIALDHAMSGWSLASLTPKEPEGQAGYGSFRDFGSQVLSGSCPAATSVCFKVTMGPPCKRVILGC